MTANLIKTEEIIEYRNFYFAEVSKIEFNGKLFGYYYEDKCGEANQPKSWYVIFYSMKLENEITLPENCHFGEDCIYCHDIDTVNILCGIISQMELSNDFPIIN